MSTFDGVVPEFPDIQVDYFRKSPERQAPLACFLSHVHSDHLQGLESFRAPFIYCSSATREILLRIEKYPHRMNFQKGILESRRLHYKHLAKLLRPVPLNTPTEIELTPRRRIRVTLFDANHCTGAVMFLIEGDGKAILYTGDIRAERWWINSLVRHPVLLPYTLGGKRIEKLYLDTTFACTSNPFREFPSKAEGLAELLRKVHAYPDETIFYFRAWTFGYEDVWLALSAALNSKIHLDRYQLGLYQSLANASNCRGVSEGPALCGFNLGNEAVPGCLSGNESSRIHSCEPGLSCQVARRASTVYIAPIVNRTNNGAELPEVGTGGGLGDLYQIHELELPDESVLAELDKISLQHIQDEEALTQIRNTLSEAFRSRRKALILDKYGLQDEGEISLSQLVTMLSRGPSSDKAVLRSGLQDMPNTIRFPYSRHSSYSELSELVAAFRPKDIYPCTVDLSSWNEDVSMRRLFGHLCSGTDFSHDAYMREILGDKGHDDGRARKRLKYDEELWSQSTQSSVTEESHVTIKQPAQSPSENDHLRSQMCRFEGQVVLEDLSTQPQPSISSSQSHMSSLLIPESEALVNTSSISEDSQAKAKRDEIRKARRYLHDHAEPGLLQIGPLPSSWPSEGDEEVNSNEELEATVSPRQKAQTLSPIYSNSNNEQKSHASKNENQLSTPEDDHPQDSQCTDSFPLSISESVLVPSSSALLDEDSRLVPNHASPDQEQELNRQAARESHLARTHARVAAYLAAAQDTYSAWADVSLVSAGDNHAEEEMEL